MFDDAGAAVLQQTVLQGSNTGFPLLGLRRSHSSGTELDLKIVGRVLRGRLPG